MESTTQTSSCFFLRFQIFFLVSYYVIHLSFATDTISSGQFLKVGQTLISAERNFEFGFFSPGNSSNYYIGIWYKEVPRLENTIPWVANRDAPLRNPASSEVRLLEDGNLVLFEGSNRIWSTNLTSTQIMNSTEGVLQDNGNLILRNVGTPSRVLWQSFDYPTDTFLPGAKFGYDRRTNRTQVLTSWKSPNDPSTGVFTLEIDPTEDRMLMKNNTQTYWITGPWDGQSFIQPIITISSVFNLNYVKNENESYLTYDVYNFNRLVMESTGRFTHYTWNDELQEWSVFWSQPKTQCDVHAYCGAFSVCSMQNETPSCYCIQGFNPRDSRNWHELRNFSGGCERRTPLQCGNLDGFLPMSRSRMVGHQHYLEAANEEECRLQCVNDCSCSAYAYSHTCSIWRGELLGLHQVSNVGDMEVLDVYIRLTNSDLQTSSGNNMGSNIWIIVGAAAAVLVLGLGVGYIWFKKRTIRKGGGLTLRNEETVSRHLNQHEDFELPVFDFITIATATNQFSPSNKIGEGGFGLVYKGVLRMGEEIAIKRLSKNSSQGLPEFMNEVRLIAKLQHRNLVMLLGCCIQGDERMLIYEYMSNKSLDSFIFDKTRSGDLNWTQRFNIIVGIARGLLYLHQDSRLRIIHRDLKASNVLLDSKMNPKISDFGTARTFRGDQIEDNTKMVVGTHGYMAPEYATDGHFSVKSDVFSFGVLLLEIVSGKKNRGFRHASHDLNLLGHTWKLVKDNKTLELMDESMEGPFSASEVVRCIHIGLLCVQKFPEDRPTMAFVTSMLDSEGVLLPCAKEPGFYVERSPFFIEASSSQDTNVSINEVTVTLLAGR